MNFNTHSRLKGLHAFLSASKYHWINYDSEKLDASYLRSIAARRGTQLHELAQQLIALKVKLPDTTQTLNAYVNDCIGFNMHTEQPLYFSENCFCTTDAIAFKDNKLRIFDLKTGETITSEHQLEVYAAVFCLEYKINPFDIEIELRIYQNDEILIFDTDPDVIVHIMQKIIAFDKRINKINQEVAM